MVMNQIDRRVCRFEKHPSDVRVWIWLSMAGLILLFIPLRGWCEAGVYVSSADFLKQSFDQVPESRTLWLDEVLLKDVETILNHPYRGLRIRYWQQGEKTAWILNEIGKDQPITVGVVVHGGTLEHLEVLVFRESRGWEVKYPFFTEQFRGAGLDNDLELSRNIDGISGATLSVRALTRIARLSLLLHQSTGKTETDPEVRTVQADN